LSHVQQHGTREEREEAAMPLLKPPEPTVAKRKYYIRIDEPLARTMERYVEFIGARSADHVITQALELVFKKDTDFRDWLKNNPAPSLESSLRKANAKHRGQHAEAADTPNQPEVL
jgi:hypothetical protein